MRVWFWFREDATRLSGEQWAVRVAESEYLDAHAEGLLQRAIAKALGG